MTSVMEDLSEMRNALGGLRNRHYLRTFYNEATGSVRSDVVTQHHHIGNASYEGSHVAAERVIAMVELPNHCR